MDEVKQTEDNFEPEKREDKQSTKTFTQSEVDQIAGRAVKSERQKYEDYEEIKSQYEALMQEKKEKELSEKSEVERLNALYSEVVTQNTDLTNELSTYKKKQLRQDVLNGAKYRGLPRAYQNLVELSDDKDSLIASADKVLEEYNNDTGKKVSETFGIPQQKDTTLVEPKKTAENPADLATSLRSKILNTLKQQNRG